LANIIEFFKIDEFFSTGWYNEVWATAICSVTKELCTKLLAGLMDSDTSIDNPDRIDVMTSHFPAGTST